MTAPNPIPTLERDPVCGMTVNPATAKHVHDHDGKKYYFCAASCRETFKANPQTYLNQPGLVTLGTRGADTLVRQPPPPQSYSETNPSPAYVCPMCPEVHEAKPGACPSCGMALEPEVPLPSTNTEYTCPMHPQIVRPGPGHCPICGMALEPRTVSASTEENPELRDMTRRFWVGVDPDRAAACHRHGRHVLAAHRFMGVLDMPTAINGCHDLVRIPPRHSRRPLVRPAVLPALLDVPGQPQPQHVHADRPGHRRRLHLQRGRDRRPANFPRVTAPHGRISRRLFRSRRRDHHASPARPGDGTPRPQPHQRRHSRLARPKSKNGAPIERRRLRKRYSARRSETRRPPARPSRRKNPRRRRRPRRPQLGERIDDHRRIASRSKSRPPAK